MPAKPTLTAVRLPQRAAPPRDLPPVAAKLWRSVVLDYPPGHFSAANLALLETLCRAWDLADGCNKAIAAEGLFPSGKAHPAIAVRGDAWAQIRGCATKLRLAMSSVERANAAVRPDAKHALPKPWEKQS